MRKLVEAGRIYIAKPPLYKVTLSKSAKEESMYAWDDAALEKISKKHKVKSIQRFKGLGEMNADQLYDTTMNPNTRTLIQVKVDDLADTERRIRILMGDQVEPRRDWIEANVSFSQEDTFEIED
jgi:topoisomerase-4 subunit B